MEHGRLVERLCLDFPLSLRLAAEDDDRFMRTLYRSTRDDLAIIPGGPLHLFALLDMQYLAQVMGYRSTYPRALYLLVECHGEAVGRIVLNESGDEIRVVDLAFLPQARSCGYGTRIIGVLQRMEVPLTLSVYRSNPRARKLYVRLGFVPVDSDSVIEQMRWSPKSPSVGCSR